MIQNKNKLFKSTKRILFKLSKDFFFWNSLFFFLFFGYSCLIPLNILIYRSLYIIILYFILNYLKDYNIIKTEDTPRLKRFKAFFSFKFINFLKENWGIWRKDTFFDFKYFNYSIVSIVMLSCWTLLGFQYYVLWLMIYGSEVSSFFSVLLIFWILILLGFQFLFLSYCFAFSIQKNIYLKYNYSLKFYNFLNWFLYLLLIFVWFLIVSGQLFFYIDIFYKLKFGLFEISPLRLYLISWSNGLDYSLISQWTEQDLNYYSFGYDLKELGNALKEKTC